jgi:hypothetical protein
MSSLKLGKSCNNSRAKKATQFRTGCQPRRQRLQQSSVKTDHELSPCTQSFSRLTSTEAEDVSHLTNSTGTGVLQYRLRPTTEREERKHEIDIMNENLIVNVDRMLQLITHVHQIACKGSKLSLNIDKRVGLCVHVSLKCAVCKYQSPTMPMSDLIHEQNKPGPPGGALNSQLILPVLKTKTGISDVANVLSCLNIRPPTTRSMQTKFNNMSQTATQLNEQQMSANQQCVKNITVLAGAEPMADVQFDVSYSSRPQGGCEKATQSFGALIEHTTKRKLPLAIAIANKHCKIGGCAHESCSKTFPTEQSIASTERTLLQHTLAEVERQGIIDIDTITTDASAQEGKAVRDFYSGRVKKPKHYKCFIHRLRTLNNDVKKLDLKSIPKRNNKTVYKQKLASSIRARVRQELINLKKKKLSKQDFLSSGDAAVGNIVDCFSGQHENCRQVSSACIAHYDNYSTKNLPNGVHLELSKEDCKTIKDKIATKFDRNGLADMQELYNTNMCESLHSIVYSIAPKTTRYSRNFAGLCHSATHSRTVGAGQATLELAKATGIKVPHGCAMETELRKKDSRRKYHAKRKTSQSCKSSRYYSRKRKNNTKLFTDSLYSSGNVNSDAASDHSYGLTS